MKIRVPGKPVAVTETDLIENDKAPVTLADGVISFTIQPFGFKTFRMTRSAAPQAVTGIKAAFDAKGCLVSWKEKSAGAFYELFRGTSADFKPGTTYRYTVKARDIAGNLSPDATPAEVTTLP